MRDKSQLRREFLHRREALNDRYAYTNSLMIKSLDDWLRSRNPAQVFFFLSHRGEPDLRSLANRAPPVWGLPVIEPASKTMEFYPWTLGDPIVNNRFGIGEPVSRGQVMTPSRDTIVLVPSVAVTDAGRRLGFGGGYYDRYLSRCRQVARVACLFEEFVVPQLPSDAHDASMQYIATEKGVRPVGVG